MGLIPPLTRKSVLDTNGEIEKIGHIADAFFANYDVVEKFFNDYNAGDIPKDEILDELNAAVRCAYHYKRYEVLNRLIDNYERSFKTALNEIQHLPPEQHPLNIMQYFVDRLDTDASWALPEYDGSISEASKRQHRQQTYEHLQKLRNLPGVSITDAIRDVIETKIEAFPENKRYEISQQCGRGTFVKPTEPELILDQHNPQITAAYNGEGEDGAASRFASHYAEQTYHKVAPSITSDSGTRQRGVDNTKVETQVAFALAANAAGVVTTTGEKMIRGGQAANVSLVNKKYHRAGTKFATPERAYEVARIAGIIFAHDLGLYVNGVIYDNAIQTLADECSDHTIDFLAAAPDEVINSRMIRPSVQASAILQDLRANIEQFRENETRYSFTAAEEAESLTTIPVAGKGGCGCTIM